MSVGILFMGFQSVWFKVRSELSLVRQDDLYVAKCLFNSKLNLIKVRLYFWTGVKDTYFILLFIFLSLGAAVCIGFDYDMPKKCVKPKRN